MEDMPDGQKRKVGDVKLEKPIDVIVEPIKQEENKEILNSTEKIERKVKKPVKIKNKKLNYTQLDEKTIKTYLKLKSEYKSILENEEVLARRLKLNIQQYENDAKKVLILRAEKHDGSTSQNIYINFQNPALAQLADVMPVSTSGKLNPLQKIIPDDWATWSEGSVSFGKIGETNLSSAQDMPSLGISIGADKKVNENRILGVVLRVGNNDVEVGTYGSAVDLHLNY
jgi:hypothetical protein